MTNISQMVLQVHIQNIQIFEVFILRILFPL